MAKLIQAFKKWCSQWKVLNTVILKLRIMMTKKKQVGYQSNSIQMEKFDFLYQFIKQSNITSFIDLSPNR